jgi:hypothetical protein
VKIFIGAADAPVLRYQRSGLFVRCFCPRKKQLRKNCLDKPWLKGSPQLSTQVLQEFFVVATRKLAVPLARDEAE